MVQVQKTLTHCIAAFLLVLILLSCGCDSMNRKHFTKLEPTGRDSECRYFKFHASTGAAGITCSSKGVCRVDNSRRKPIWPMDDAEAERTRMRWLATSLAEQGCQDAEYEIISRKPVMVTDYTVARSTYDICYDIRVKANQ